MTGDLSRLSNVELEQKRAATRERRADARAVLVALDRALEELDAEYVHRMTGLSVGCEVRTDDALIDAMLDQLIDVDLWTSEDVRAMAIRKMAPEDRPHSFVASLYIYRDEMLADVDLALTGRRVRGVLAENLTKVEEAR